MYDAYAPLGAVDQARAVGLRPVAITTAGDETNGLGISVRQAVAAPALRAGLPVVAVVRGRQTDPRDPDALATIADFVRRAGGRYVVAEGAGHFVQSERPDVVIEAIRSALGR
jgi:pimeloyl-ACP methyl ester carboxylesterase